MVSISSLDQHLFDQLISAHSLKKAYLFCDGAFKALLSAQALGYLHDQHKLQPDEVVRIVRKFHGQFKPGRYEAALAMCRCRGWCGAEPWDFWGDSMREYERVAALAASKGCGLQW